jgi:hypothetical protein
VLFEHGRDDVDLVTAKLPALKSLPAEEEQEG